MINKIAIIIDFSMQVLIIQMKIVKSKNKDMKANINILSYYFMILGKKNIFLSKIIINFI